MLNGKYFPCLGDARYCLISTYHMNAVTSCCLSFLCPSFPMLLHSPEFLSLLLQQWRHTFLVSRHQTAPHLLCSPDHRPTWFASITTVPSLLFFSLQHLNFILVFWVSSFILPLLECWCLLHSSSTFSHCSRSRRFFILYSLCIFLFLNPYIALCFGLLAVAFEIPAFKIFLHTLAT